MSTSLALPRSTVPSRRGRVVVHETIAIPGWVEDLDSYRAWAFSDDYPATGSVSYLNGELWVDTSMEEFLTHNQVKAAYNGCLIPLSLQLANGRFVPDRMLLTHPGVNLSTEPDGLFYLWETLRSGRLKLIAGKKSGFMELEGTPDMVLEVVSETSERKDTEVLRELYWKAGIAEYWLVDARGAEPRFDILRLGPQGYVETPSAEGWLASQVFGRSFKLEVRTDPLGQPLFVLEVT